jgi:hypothetical protein
MGFHQLVGFRISNPKGKLLDIFFLGSPGFDQLFGTGGCRDYF